ncbi:MAG: EF-hand domain-containing protein [Polaromonas sp.]|uniref:EF-hand domain-containing protein n=1 Tax=Polaromonas sp. TaxID=1869339 RepID=UPI0024887BE6|nr:EF-hand domain-containing protein [Polaromonas sp.]MDI1271195.1 EF-hand domain-containing protein [Polaromonas sp.]
MTSAFHFIPNFEIRSVALLAALTVGAALGAHAQGADTAGLKTPSGAGTPSTQSAPSPSGPTNQEVGAAFIRADANKDGQLSRQEAVRLPAVEQRFDQSDTNKDKLVSREEFEIALKS